ncbi:hypothetical protein PORCRE_817 [Porphyromonas crevioricanis JCM 15906]|uniref:Uncharacterized protein n=1 Tax=Porphyromonas crevioricanis JCM 15906 TaxID=1305617 RepID=T1DS40_9PORP|nr:hypothetical protein PORCRE_817 [Porphyromonas crevioricanis JCM 15906]
MSTPAYRLLFSAFLAIFFTSQNPLFIGILRESNSLLREIFFSPVLAKFFSGENFRSLLREFYVPR